jgi:hypothetical protein
MQRILLAISILAAGNGTVSAQQPVVAIPISCQDCGGERFHHVSCHATQKGIYQKGDEPAAMAQDEPPGQYLAPPANGPVFGESNSVGVEGLSVHFPPLNLSLPTLKLPALFRVRHNARMVTNPSEAPFTDAAQTSAPVQLMMVPGPPARTAAPEPDAAPQSPSQKTPVQQSFKGVSYQPSDDVGYAQTEEIRRLQRQLENLQQVLGRLEGVVEAQNAYSNSVSSRLPATRQGQYQSSAQPASHVEPIRLPLPAVGLQRLPSSR